MILILCIRKHHFRVNEQGQFTFSFIPLSSWSIKPRPSCITSFTVASFPMRSNSKPCSNWSTHTYGVIFQTYAPTLRWNCLFWVGRFTFSFACRSGASGVVSGCVEASAWAEVFHVLIQLRRSESFFSNLQDTEHSVCIGVCLHFFLFLYSLCVIQFLRSSDFCIHLHQSFLRGSRWSQLLVSN